MQQWECKTTHIIPSTDDTLYDFETKALNLKPGEASKGEVEDHAGRLRSNKGCRRQILNHCTLTWEKFWQVSQGEGREV
jgi:hypothetical protein